MPRSRRPRRKAPTVLAPIPGPDSFGTSPISTSTSQAASLLLIGSSLRGGSRRAASGLRRAGANAGRAVPRDSRRRLRVGRLSCGAGQRRAISRSRAATTPRIAPDCQSRSGHTREGQQCGRSLLQGARSHDGRSAVGRLSLSPASARASGGGGFLIPDRGGSHARASHAGIRFGLPRFVGPRRRRIRARARRPEEPEARESLAREDEARAAVRRAPVRSSTAPGRAARLGGSRQTATSGATWRQRRPEPLRRPETASLGRGGYSDAARALGGTDLTRRGSNGSILSRARISTLTAMAAASPRSPTRRGPTSGTWCFSVVPCTGRSTRRTSTTRRGSSRSAVHLDLVILADGGGQRFEDPRIAENVLPIWFDHFATHDPANWQKFDIPAMP